MSWPALHFGMNRELLTGNPLDWMHPQVLKPIEKTPRISLMPWIQKTYRIRKNRGVFVQMWTPFIMPATRQPLRVHYCKCIRCNSIALI
jgi:hypothetical protein